MAEYILSSAAKQDLKNIYRYGYERFGEAQAELYFSGLIDRIEEIANDPELFQEVPEVGDSYRRCVYFSESIYYRIVDGPVEIMAIIGNQDISRRPL